MQNHSATPKQAGRKRKGKRKRQRSPGWVRTTDLLVNSQTLFRLSHGGRNALVPSVAAPHERPRQNLTTGKEHNALTHGTKRTPLAREMEDRKESRGGKDVTGRRKTRWDNPGSNQGPPDLQSGALPAELLSREKDKTWGRDGAKKRKKKSRLCPLWPLPLASAEC